jgi:hypothetical protein
LGASLTSGFAAGTVSGLSFVGAQDVYSLTTAALSGDPYVRQRLAASTHSTRDYWLAAGMGGALGLGFGALGHYAGAPGPGGRPLAGEPVLLYDANGQPLLVAGGQIVPPAASTRPITLFEPGGTPIRVSGGQVLPPQTGPVVLFDARGQPLLLSEGALTTPTDIGSTLTGTSRLVNPRGQPLAGGPAAPTLPLVDPSGQPLTPLQTGTGPVIIDLQAGAPAFLQEMVGQTPGAQGIGVESGRWILGYQGISTTSAEDLSLALQVARTAPIWPNTPAWRTPISGMPRLLPWEIDPASYLFPQTGPVRVLPEAFFPPVGQQGRLIPWNIRDIPVGGIQPSTHPSSHGIADQVYVRRPFGLAQADPATTIAMGQELNRMVRPGGFVEFRLRAQTELSVAAEGAATSDQVAAIASQIENARVVRVDRGDIQRFLRRGTLPRDPLQAEILQNAASDVRGLGEGTYVRIIRIYKGR